MQRLRMQRVTTAGLAVVALALFSAACGSSGNSSSSSGGSGGGGSSLSGTLNGSGSTFQLTFQQAAIQAYKSVEPSITVNYGGGGSGKGRTDLASGTVQFAGSDSPIPSDETSNFKGKTVLYFPVIIGPITMSYNLSGVTNLKLTPTLIANIFQAKITKWNDPAIAKVNPGVKLPSTAITIARRSDSSGTTANFSLFLQDAVPSVWKLGTSSTINWPASSRGGDGNGGVAQIVKSTPGAIGYVDFADAKASGLSFASVQNKDGSFVAPSTSAASAAAGQATVASDLTFAAVWQAGSTSYPITYQSWVLVFQKQSSASTAKLIKAYLGYLLGDGQKLLPSLNYAPLPSNIDQQAKAQLSKIGS
ncbi:MAG TPA: phosphate ABC transporter substrate-binding protein PstS [Streptosporangiaceae bacterium]